MSEQPSQSCEHSYVFLRQETRNEGYQRNPNWVPYDVFFCSRCLAREQRRVDPNYAQYDGPRNESRMR